jgi:hypothetical protein
LTPQYRPRTPNGFGSILCNGSFPPYRAQTSNEAPNFETAGTLSTGSEFPFSPADLKDFKPRYVIVDNDLYGAVPGRRAESFDGNLGRKGRSARAESERGNSFSSLGKFLGELKKFDRRLPGAALKDPNTMAQFIFHHSMIYRISKRAYLHYRAFSHREK